MSETVVCPSGARIRVGKLKLKELKLLADRKQTISGATFDRFLEAALEEVTDPGPYGLSTFSWSGALTGDRFAALLAIRTATHGADFSFEVRCSACGEIIAGDVDLNKLERKAYPEASLDAFMAKKPLEVTIAGKVVKFPVMTGADETRIQSTLDKLEKSDPRAKRAPFDETVDPIVERLTSVEGCTGREEVRAWLEELGGAETTALLDALESSSGGVETSVSLTHNVRRCRAETRIELPFFGEAFWMPRRQRGAAPSSSSPT